MHGHRWFIPSTSDSSDWQSTHKLNFNQGIFCWALDRAVAIEYPQFRHIHPQHIYRHGNIELTNTFKIWFNFDLKQEAFHSELNLGKWSTEVYSIFIKAEEI